jgi:hypothetical protein
MPKRINRKSAYQGGFTTQSRDLKLALRMVASQLTHGIGLSEAVQFAAKYYNITCSAIQAELSKARVSRAPVPNVFPMPKIKLNAE